MDQAMFLSWAVMEILSAHYNYDYFGQHKDKRDVVEKGKNCCMPLHRVVTGLKREIPAVMLSFLCYPCRHNKRTAISKRHADETHCMGLSK